MSAPQLIVLVVAAVSFVLALMSTGIRHRQRESMPPMWRLRPEDLVATGASERVAALVAQGHTIEAIKAYRDEVGVGLRAAKTAVDGLRSRARTRQLMAAGASERVASLLVAGKSIGAIKTYRQETGVGLRQAKSFVDRLRRSA